MDVLNSLRLRRAAALIAVALVTVTVPELAVAQLDLSGHWNTIRHEDQPDRGPGVGLGDYSGIPLTDAGRQWAESWDAARLSMHEQQCRVHVGHYILRGPLNLRIWEEKDPLTQQIVAIRQYISTYEQTRTIWMDGRPHPPPYARHSWMGFSTGRWSGDRLIVETTHMKQGWHRRNGVVASDWTTMTEHYVRHGDRLTQIEVIHDPVYLTEAMVKSQHFSLNLRSLPSNNWLWPCTPVEEVARDPYDVPHYLPGQNPHLEPTRAEANLLVAGVEGGPATLYPEWLSNPRQAPNPGPREAVRSFPFATAPIEVWPVRDDIYMLVGAGGNATLQLGDNGVLIVDAKLDGSIDAMLAAIRSITDKPIRMIVNTSADLDHLGGNADLAAAGSTRTGGVVVAQIGGSIVESAAIVAHENALHRVSAPTGESSTVPYESWPTDTFFTARRDFTFNGEGIEVLHQPAAHSDADVFVFFRRSDVLSVGDTFSTTSYPVIDTTQGGTIQGLLAALNRIIELAIPDVDQQGGTLIVPGHGRLSDEMDVVEYRDMVTIVRDRVQAMIDRGAGLDEVLAARPTFDFDARYGAERGPWTTDDFVSVVYRGLAGAQ
jgi:glyoxylase-like metal-dependent hydrolase (beta-lactamase superfamily II)